MLGGAQLGLPYGITNSTTFDREKGVALVKEAISLGVRAIDTARAYGRSEEVIGDALVEYAIGRARVYTKIDTLKECEGFDGVSEVVRSIKRSIDSSCNCLGIDPLDVVMLHRADQLDRWGGVAIESLRGLRAEGRLRGIGVSVQSPEEALRTLVEPDIVHIQLPSNVLDYRWNQVRDELHAIRLKRQGFPTVHVRSIFLQGLLVSNDQSLWRRANVDDAVPVIAWLKSMADHFTEGSIPNLCIRWGTAQDWVDGLVIGVENKVQLTNALEAMALPPLSGKTLEMIERSRPKVSAATLDPVCWRNSG